jgi:hypothetical protein
VVWVSVAKAADLAPAGACVVRARGLDLALVCTTDGLFAIDIPKGHGDLLAPLTPVSALCCAAAWRLMRYAR